MPKLSDQKLYELCVHFGEQARLARQKFLGLLPEVNRRKIYASKGFRSIFEFAFKLGGVSEEQVHNALNLNQKFAKLPRLREQLVKGQVSLNKLIRVASVVNSENEDFWAQQVKILPQKTLEVLVHDQKIAAQQQASSEQSQLRAQLASPEEFQSVKLPADIAKQLQELQHKGINIGVLLRQFLAEREAKIASEKKQLSLEVAQANSSRYIPVKIKKVIAKEHGSKCSISHCAKLAENLHHTRRFAVSQNHDPHFIAPLCREHHQIAHAVDANYLRMRRATVST